jgi:ubiquinone/menaquinone biosynthesis C-methylase UbiE
MEMSRLQRTYVNRPKNADKKIQFLERLMEGIDMKGIEKVLEVGCGPGYLSAHLSEEYDVEVIGTDVDPIEIEFAVRTTNGKRGLAFVQADSTQLPFDDGEFDLVFSQMVLHHIQEWEVALSEISRVLRPQGYYLFHDLTYSRLLTAIFQPLMKSHSFYSVEEIEGYLESCGFRKVFELSPGTYYCRQFTEYNKAFQKN